MTKSWFKQLQAIWNARLAESAFVDIENEAKRLKQFEAEKFQNTTSLEYAQREAYYRIAYQFAHNYDFASALDRKVWLFHSQGISSVDTGMQLKITPYQAQQIIKLYKPLMLAQPTSKVISIYSKGGKS